MQYYLLMSVDRAMTIPLLLKMQFNCTPVEKCSGLSLSGAEVSNNIPSFKSYVVLGSTFVIVKILEKGDVRKEQN